MADEERIEPTLDPNAAAPAAGPATPANGEKPQEVEKPKEVEQMKDFNAEEFTAKVCSLSDPDCESCGA